MTRPTDADLIVMLEAAGDHLEYGYRQNGDTHYTPRNNRFHKAVDALRAEPSAGDWRTNSEVQKAFHDYAGGEPMCADATWRRRVERLLDEVWAIATSSRVSA